MKMKKLRAAKRMVPSAAAFTPSLPRSRGASRKLRFVSCAADELFCGASPRLDGRNAQNKQFMMRQGANFCKLISRSAKVILAEDCVCLSVRFNAECGIDAGMEGRRRRARKLLAAEQFGNFAGN